MSRKEKLLKQKIANFALAGFINGFNPLPAIEKKFTGYDVIYVCSSLRPGGYEKPTIIIENRIPAPNEDNDQWEVIVEFHGVEHYSKPRSYHTKLKFLDKKYDLDNGLNIDINDDDLYQD